MRKDIRRGLCGLVLAAGTAASGSSAASAAEPAPWTGAAVHHQVLRVAAAPATAGDVRIAAGDVVNGAAATVVPGSPGLREEVARHGPVPPLSSPTLTVLILLTALVGAGCATGGPASADRERTPVRT
jgi:hypothetical protein